LTEDRMSTHPPDTGAEPARAAAAGRHEADVAFIEALARILARHELTELAVKRDGAGADGLEVRVVRAPAPTAAAAAAPAVPLAQAHAMPAPLPAAAAPAIAQPDDPALHPGAVTSPMVGTAYLAPEPGATPFVTLGATVAAGQTLLIIEAMKTMNQIPSPRAGIVRRILIEDGTPVEYGAPLMIVE
jgi:acetyl-CoA carboxylase biotin carboxyl carrier protein